MNLSFPFRRQLVPAFLAILFFLAPNTIGRVNADTSRDLQHAVHRLNIWLGPSENSESWRKFLNLNSLESQAARGAQADVGQLAEILGRFSAEAKGLDAPPFNDVRLALQAQIQQLSQATSGDLFDEILQARRNYVQISIAQLQHRRDKAVYDLRLLQKFYKSHLSSRDRAEAYYDLKLDELIEFLERMRFELPPDISVGKLNDRMSAVKRNLDELESQLDELPEVEEIPNDPPQPENSDDLQTGEPSGQPPTSDKIPEANPHPTEDKNQGNSIADQQLGDNEVRRQRAAIKQEIQGLTREYDQIKQLRDDVRKLDLGRQTERARNWRELGVFTKGFVEVSKRRSDYFFESSYHSYSKFALLYFYGTDDNLEADFNKVLDTLEQELPKLAEPDNRAAAVLVTDATGWLEATELAPRLVTAIQARHSSPNIKISISNGFVNQIGAQTVRQTLPVNEQIFGRLIRGMAQSDSRVTIDFLDDPNQVRVSLRLAGNVNARSHTQSGPVTAFAGASGNYEGRQNLAMNVGGLLAGKPYVAARISSELYGVSSQLEFVQKIARKMYLRDRVRNELESARRLETRVRNEFTDQTSDALSQAVNGLKDLLEKTVEFGDYVPEMHLYTTSDQLIAVGHKTLFEFTDVGRVSNLASPVAGNASSMNADIAIQLHESLLGNYIDAYFVNRTFSNDQLAKRIEELTGESSEGLATDEDAGDEPWSITFASVRPIQLEFDNNAFAVTVTGRRFTQGDTTYQAGLKFRLPFKIKRQDGKLKLLRDGDVTIEYIEPDKKTAKLVAFKSLLETKLNSAGRQQDEDENKKSPLLEGVELPDNLIPVDRVERLKENLAIANAMKLVEFRMVDGWLYAGWNYLPENETTTWQFDTPAIWEGVAGADGRQGLPQHDTKEVTNEVQQIEGSILN